MPNKITNQKRWLALGAFACVYLGWGSTYLAIRIALQSIPPFLIGAARFLAAGALLYFHGRGEKPTRAQWRVAALLGFELFLVGNGAVIWAEQFVPSGITALIIACLPVFVSLFSWMQKGGKRPSALAVVGMAGGLVGVALLMSADSSDRGAAPVSAVVVLLLAACSWAIGSLQAKKGRPRSSAQAIGMQMIAGGVFLSVASLFAGEWRGLRPAEITLASLLAVGYLALVGSILAFSCYMWLLKNVEPEQASTYAYVNPIVALILGVAFGGEAFRPTTALAAVIILSSVMAILAPKRKQAYFRPEGSTASWTRGKRLS